ncbi:methylglutaconyl-CoA hydratase [Amylibacter marinus]|uniref:Methylglutaconyl-CoA hydratase n=1 Tax=Amylibacter marinus TaxID=1475483 RepID=A0ABQ5VV62_9RHOB|nr:enoyl-CoA hydratase-related protein [Amylibacter marinus]GLQ35315.1 methylglutaconyl-CoA hydratase [Amylibacter marinus]
MSMIEVTTDQRGVGKITLARSEKHNALSSEMMQDLTHAAINLAQDEAVRVVVLAAQGRSFCAGADLNWMREQLASDRAGKMEQAQVLAGMLASLDQLPKPLIGCVQGNAFGGGLGMMSVCDVVLAEPDLKFALTETKLGLIPATIGPFVLRRIGMAAARRVFFTGKVMNTSMAQDIGLVSKIVARGDMEGALEQEIAPMLQTAPNAVAQAKALLRQLSAQDDAEDMRITTEALADCWETEEAQTRITEFLEKTK